MGRTIICLKCKSTFDESVLENRENPNICPVCGASLVDGEEEHSDWITWYYYGHKSDNGKTASLRDNPIDLEKFGDTFFLIKEFQAPPRDSEGKSDAAKAELRKYVPDAFAAPKSAPKVQCPYCFSTQVQMVPKKFSLLTGFATNGYNRVCVRCQRKF